MFDCDPVEVVDRQLAAYQAGDLGAFVAMYAPDAVVFEHPDTPAMSGRAEIETGYAPGFAARNFSLSIGGRIVNGDFVIDEEVFTADGAEVARGVVIYRVKDCLIQNSWLLPMGGEGAQ